MIKVGYSGVLPSVLSEQFPVEIRAVGIAFSFSISVTIFGGFAPFVADKGSLVAAMLETG